MRHDLHRAAARPLLLALILAPALATASSHDEAAQGVVREMPPPLPDRPFTMPEVERATLSNGLEVMLVRDTEVPLFDLQLVLRGGGWADPVGLEGLASATFAMLDEGAGGLSADAISREARRLGGYVAPRANGDGASIGVGGTVRNLEPLLDLFATVALQPDFPEEAWSILQRKRIEDLVAAKDDANAIAARVGARLVWGDASPGRLSSPESYQAMTTEALRGFHATHVRPDQAVVLVGGDVSLATLVAALEARLGAWTADGEPMTRPAETPVVYDAAVLHVVDKPGAAQSVLSVSHPTLPRGAEGYFDLVLGNTVLGGAFTARVNMNLREDKGWTYGARCFLRGEEGPSIWGCSTSVVTPQTGPSIEELRGEITGILGDAPITDEEIAFFRGYLVNGFPRQFETAAGLVDELEGIWLHDLPTDYLERYLRGIGDASREDAEAALRRWIHPDRLSWLVVGDLDVVGEDLEALGLPLVELDRDGNPLEAK